MNQTKDPYNFLFKHWTRAFNWSGISPMRVADEYECSAEYVRTVMRAIETTHLKPLPAHPKQKTCKYCSEPIIFVGKHACNIPVIKGVAIDEKIQTFRQLHCYTCKRAERWQGGIDASGGE